MTVYPFFQTNKSNKNSIISNNEERQYKKVLYIILLALTYNHDVKSCGWDHKLSVHFPENNTTGKRVEGKGK